MNKDKKEALVGNAADEKQVKGAGQKEKINRISELNDICFILDKLEGRRFLWRLLGVSGVYNISFTGENNLTNFNEGKRCVGNQLLGDIMEANPDAYLQMINENRGSK